MNARTIRRAIERKAQKEARKAHKAESRQQLQALAAEREIVTAEYEAAKATLIQVQANRRNAQLSTGPKTDEGKAVSSRNALKTGLTGKTVLLPSEDAALYEHHIESFFAELNPVGDRETELTQSIADSKWRVARIPSLEAGIYALGRIQFAEEFATYAPAEAASLIEAKTFLSYQRQLNNLSIQENRLRRQCEKDTAELKRLQADRAQAAAKANAASAATPKPSPATAPAIEIGFEFSTSRIDTRDSNPDLRFVPLTHPQAA